MRYLLYIFIGIILSECMQAQTNRALLIAIDRYPEESGWSEIHATNDVPIIQQMLKQNGYDAKHVSVLLNEKACKSHIIGALNAICKQSKAGDYVYIHFSCHGQQMWDDSGDEPDGLDEALIPYDALRRFTQGKYEGQKHLRDDELEIQLEKIRKKLTSSGNLTVVLDACHSGTGSREGDDEEFIRGTSYIFAPDNYESPEIKPARLTLHHKTGKNSAPITVFSACLPDEINYEYKDAGKYYGALSFALCQVVEKNAEKWTNNRFSEELKKEMQRLFAGKKRKQTPYFESTDEQRQFQIGR